MQEIVSAPATPGEGDRVRGVTSALVAAGIAGGYLLSPRLREVHWQAAAPAPPAPRPAGRCLPRGSLRPGVGAVRRPRCPPAPTWPAWARR
jgi:hypothetical protein